MNLHLADNPYDGWYRNPIRGEGPCRYEDLTPFQRMLHGGDWMDVNLCRRHIHEYISRGHQIVVAEEGGKVVGECELWLADEPPPFGRYADIEMLMVSRECDRKAVELALVEKGEERARKTGYENYDVSPQHGGDSLDWEEIGFREIRDTRMCTADIRDIDEPDFDFEMSAAVEDYETTRRLHAWNHREPPQLGFEFSVGLWPPAKLAGFDRHEKRIFERVSVKTFGIEYFLLALKPDWRESEVIDVDIWSAQSALKKREQAQVIVKSAAAAGSRLGKGILEVCVPKQLLPAMRELGFKGGEKRDPWLRKGIVPGQR